MIRIYDGRSDLAAVLDQLTRRNKGADETILCEVRSILKDVKERGDEALVALTQRFDWPEATAKGLLVGQDEIDAAYSKIAPELLSSLRESAKNISEFHELQRREGFMTGPAGRRTGQIVRPLKRVGVYVPGGRAAYPSSVLMNVIPAKVAGVEQIIMVTPADRAGKVPPLTLVAANEAGVSKVYRVGGAQAVAALAYGTESIDRVDKIVGPGNIYVALAKREVFGTVGIDMLAGPSEVLIIADARANPAFVAADMLSQAEHDPLAAAICVTTDPSLAGRVQTELALQTLDQPRRKIIEQSLENQGAIVIAKDLTDAVDIANAIAPEHLELMVENPGALLERIENAGSVFLGDFSPEPLGDYYAGPNHILPTSGTARFASPLSVDDFIKKMGVILYSRDALASAARDIMRFAAAEGLGAHARSVGIRFEKNG